MGYADDDDDSFFRLNWNWRCCCEMLARNGFSFMSNMLGAGVSMGVWGMRKPPEVRLAFIRSACVALLVFKFKFMEGAAAADE